MKQTPLNSSWVAHRGDRAGGIENTLNAFEYAAKHGAIFAECDIQFTRDCVPVVFHDADLKRICGLPDCIADLSYEELQSLSAAYINIPSLAALLVWLEKTPQLTLFLEIKEDIGMRKTAHEVAQLMCQLLPENLNARIVLISMAGSILDACKDILPCKSGWVAEGDDKPNLAIDYIFMPFDNVLKTPRIIEDWHQKNVQVGLYTVNHQATAQQLFKLGADFVETDHFSDMVVQS